MGVGPSEARWIGNKEGRAGKTYWSLLRQKDELAGKVYYTEFMSGHEDGEKWVQGEVDVSIRPGWFYHAVALNPVIHAGEVGGSQGEGHCGARLLGDLVWPLRAGAAHFGGGASPFQEFDFPY
ncbi:MAG: hypothetical protein ABI850_09235, partial [Flavobacterium sp.]